jgi:hypothetical protein
MRTTDSIALVVIAGGLWANVLISSPVHRALASDVDGEGRGFAIAGAQSVDGPVVWRLEKKTGKIQLCTVALGSPKEEHKPAPPGTSNKFTSDRDLFEDAPQGIAEPPGHEHALGTAKDAADAAHAFNEFPQGLTEQEARFAAIHVACSEAGP